MRCEWLHVPIYKDLLKYTMKLQQDLNEVLRFQMRFQDSKWDSKIPSEIPRFQWDSKGVVRDLSWWRTPQTEPCIILDEWWIHYLQRGVLCIIHSNCLALPTNITSPTGMYILCFKLLHWNASYMSLDSNNSPHKHFAFKCVMALL